MVQRPTTSDPFAEPAEPRIPPGSDAEGKLKVFRETLKGKDAALARGRALYQAVDTEAQQLRACATQMKGQLEAALAEVQRNAELPQQLASLRDMLEKDTERADSAEKKMEQLVGRYAVNFKFGDAHNTGIFRWEMLRRLDPLEEEQWGPPESIGKQ